MDDKITNLMITIYRKDAAMAIPRPLRENDSNSNSSYHFIIGIIAAIVTICITRGTKQCTLDCGDKNEMDEVV